MWSSYPTASIHTALLPLVAQHDLTHHSLLCSSYCLNFIQAIWPMINSKNVRCSPQKRTEDCEITYYRTDTKDSYVISGLDTGYVRQNNLLELYRIYLGSCISVLHTYIFRFSPVIATRKLSITIGCPCPNSPFGLNLSHYDHVCFGKTSIGRNRY
jgi:hypothetical protein